MIYMFFLHKYHSSFITICFILSFEIGGVMLLALFLLFRNVLVILVLLCLTYFSTFVKSVMGVLI